MDLQRPAAVTHEVVLGFSKIGPMGAAFVMRLVLSRLLQHGTGDAHMLGLAIVGGTGKGQFLVSEAEMIGSSGFNHGHALKGLDGGAWKYRGGKIARGLYQLAFPIHHGEGPGMAAFNNATTGDFGNNRVGQGRSSFKLAMGAKRYQIKAKNSKAKSRPKAQI